MLLNTGVTMVLKFMHFHWWMHVDNAVAKSSYILACVVGPG